MSRLRVEFHPEAGEEAAALIWYSVRSRRAAQRFEEELEGIVESIAQDPMRWPILEGEARRILFRRFPYSLLYRAFEDRVEVLAVAHGRRKPGYWRERAQN